MVEALRAECRLCEILPVVGMAKSSYEYARRAQAKGETEEHAAARKAVIEASGASGGTYGCRRIYAQASADAEDGAAIGEWTVRSIMEEENLVACAARKKRRYSSYEGEISEAPENLLRDDRGKHHFRANKPNELWITDVTEFRIPAGKVYLSPIVDCFDGMPLSWSISTSPDAEMASPPLLGACKWLGEGDHPKIHSDRGCHYRWPGWIKICKENGLVRSMSRKGCSPDNARCEGLCAQAHNGSAPALPWQLPVRPTESLTSCAAAQAASSALVYWLPRSLRDMAPPATYPREYAISRAATTKPALMLSRMLQPTAMRVHRSMATAR